MCMDPRSPESVDVVIRLAEKTVLAINQLIAAGGRLGDRPAYLVRLAATSGNDPRDIAGRRILQGRQPLVVAALVDQLGGGNHKGDLLTAERFHKHTAADVMALKELDDLILTHRVDRWLRGVEGGHVVLLDESSPQSDSQREHETPYDARPVPEP